MEEVAWAMAFLLIFLGSSAAGLWLQGRLGERHHDKETIESVRMIVSMVVTFSAIVLGLLVTSVKTDFDDHTELYKKYGIALIELNQRLSDYGPQTTELRHLLRSYTAAVFVLNWPAEPHPAGDYPTVLHHASADSDELTELSGLLSSIDDGIYHLAQADSLHQQIAAVLQDDVRRLEAVRWTVIQRSASKLSPVFIAVLVSWLLIVFFVFGVVSPRNGLVVVALFLSSVAVATCLYLILDLDTSLGGFISVSSRPFRDALWHMSQIN